MPYFRELPNIQYASVFNGRKSIDEYTTAKNLFKRAKLREDIANYVTAFTYYQIKDDERPDQIAKKIYDDPKLDWIILLTNNITDVNEEWPLSNDSLYKYLLEKYGSDEELQKVHHYETVEYKDEFNRTIIEGGLYVDPSTSETITTNTTSNSYLVNSFPNPKRNTIVSVNLNQRVSVYGRDIRQSVYNITNIQTNISYLEIPSAKNQNQFIEITILNSLANWPNGWGGVLKIKPRTGDDIDIVINDVILDNKVRIPERLYEYTGTLVDGVLQPTFNFTNELPSA